MASSTPGSNARCPAKKKWSQVPFWCLLRHVLLVACSVYRTVVKTGFARVPVCFASCIASSVDGALRNWFRYHNRCVSLRPSSNHTLTMIPPCSGQNTSRWFLASSPSFLSQNTHKADCRGNIFLMGMQRLSPSHNHNHTVTHNKLALSSPQQSLFWSKFWWWMLEGTAKAWPLNISRPRDYGQGSSRSAKAQGRVQVSLV